MNETGKVLLSARQVASYVGKNKLSASSSKQGADGEIKLLDQDGDKQISLKELQDYCSDTVKISLSEKEWKAVAGDDGLLADTEIKGDAPAAGGGKVAVAGGRQTAVPNGRPANDGVDAYFETVYFLSGDVASLPRDKFMRVLTAAELRGGITREDFAEMIGQKVGEQQWHSLMGDKDKVSTGELVENLRQGKTYLRGTGQDARTFLSASRIRTLIGAKNLLAVARGLTENNHEELKLMTSRHRALMEAYFPPQDGEYRADDVASQLAELLNGSKHEQQQALMVFYKLALQLQGEMSRDGLDMELTDALSRDRFAATILRQYMIEGKLPERKAIEESEWNDKALGKLRELKNPEIEAKLARVDVKEPGYSKAFWQIRVTLKQLGQTDVGRIGQILDGIRQNKGQVAVPSAS
ncbi:MAG: hypothetical protein MUC35_05985 [Candidatus Margulisbacteria bacterium]|jgi:hypothetical protein|nr:hypothetical protein [Candidatus Margulisiibacteriota bacterium]